MTFRPAGTPVPVTVDGMWMMPVTALTVSAVVPVEVPVPVAGAGAVAGSMLSMCHRSNVQREAATTIRAAPIRDPIQGWAGPTLGTAASVWGAVCP